MNSNSNKNKMAEQLRKVSIKNKTECTGFFAVIVKNDDMTENKKKSIDVTFVQVRRDLNSKPLD